MTANISRSNNPDIPIYLVPGEPIRVADLVSKTRFSAGERRTYSSYLPFLLDGWTSPSGHQYPGMGDRWAHEVLPSDLDNLLEAVVERALIHSIERDAAREEAGRTVKGSKGEFAVYNAVGAFRKVFACAVRDRHLARPWNPAFEIRKPTRPDNMRRPMTQQQLREMWQLIVNGGNDPELDAMICQFILLTGARRRGVIGLNVRDIVPSTGMIWLDEKGGKRAQQPAPDWFLNLLLAFAESRGSTKPGDPVFGYRPRTDGPTEREGSRVGRRRFDTLFGRLQAGAEWADQAGLCAHLLRHHGYAIVERHAGMRVSESWARHAPDRLSKLYGRGTAAEVARAVIELHGGTHPLVRAQRV